MSLIALVLTLAIVGFVLWLILQIPMPYLVRQIIVGVVCLFMILWVLQVTGLVHELPYLRLK
jgi:hypothetical protein